MQNIPKYILWTLAAAVGIFLVWYFSNIVAYILIAAVLGIVGKPLVGLLRRVKIRQRHLPHWLAAAIALLTIWAGLLLFFIIFIPLLFSKVTEFSSFDLQYMVDVFRQPITWLQNLLEHTFSIQQSDFSLADSLKRHLDTFLNIGALNNLVTSAVSTIGNVVVALFSVSFITFFFLKEDQLFVDMLVAIFPARYEANIKHAVSSVTSLLIRYFTGMLVESLIITILVAGVLMILGMSVSDAFFMGFLMGLLNVIPYIGPLIGAGIAIFFGILNPLEWATIGQTVLVIAGTLAACKGFDDFVIQPMLYSNTAKAHPLEIFIVILVAGTAAGVVGMLLAIPAYNVVRVLAKEFFSYFPLVQKLTEKI